MKTRRSIPALGAFFVLVALVISACGSSGVPSGSVVTMAGNTISTKAVKHWMYVVAKTQAMQSPGQPVIVPNDPPQFAGCVKQVRAQIPALKSTKDAQIVKDCKQLFTTLSGQAMDFLIRAYWYQADAHRLHITVTDAQVAKAVAAAKAKGFKTDAQFQQYLTQSGQTAADVNYRIKVQQLYGKLLARHPTTVTAADVASYYAAHKSTYAKPESRDLRIILTKTLAQAAKAKAALKGGNWSAVAKQYSIDPTTKKTGGKLTGVTKGQQDSALTAAAFAPSATIGKLLGPIKGQFGYYLVEVTKITPGQQRSLAQSSALIKSTLSQKRATASQNAVNSAAKQHWLSKTQCSSDWAMADCSGYKAPKTSSSSAAAG
jgi:foldase protein PrsA